MASDAKPLGNFVARAEDMYLYVVELAMEKAKEHSSLGEKWKARMADIRFWTALPGILDQLGIMDGFNVSTQPGTTGLEKVSDALKFARSSSKITSFGRGQQKMGRAIPKPLRPSLHFTRTIIGGMCRRMLHSLRKCWPKWMSKWGGRSDQVTVSVWR